MNIETYLFLPSEFSDEEVYGYRWQVDDEVYVRVIGESGIGNLQTKIEMNHSSPLVVFTAATAVLYLNMII